MVIRPLVWGLGSATALLLVAACGGDATTDTPAPAAPQSPAPGGVAGTPASKPPATTAGSVATGMNMPSTRPPTPGATAGSTAAVGGAGAAAAAAGSTAAAGASGSGTSGAGGATGSAGSAGTVAAAGSGGTTAAAGTGGASGSGNAAAGSCCADGDCLCHGDPPSSLTSERGPFATESYALSGAGCVYYPTDAEPPFAAVAVSDGFLGSGGCGALAQTSGWGPLYASHGIVAMIIDTTGSDQPPTRGTKLTRGIAAFKEENEKSGSPLFGKLSGRYGTSGFSMGGGGTTYASQDDASLRSSVAIMPWGPVSQGVEVPTLVICGSADTIAPCASHGTPLYGGLSDDLPKMRVQVSGAHNGQPTAGGGKSGEYGLAFQKVFLEGDERWKPLLVAAESVATTIK